MSFENYLKNRSLRESDNGDYYVLYTFKTSYPDYVPKRVGILFRFDQYARLTGICDGIFSASQKIQFSEETLRTFQKKHHVGNDDQLRYILKDDDNYNNGLLYITTFDDLKDFKSYCTKYEVFKPLNEHINEDYNGYTNEETYDAALIINNDYGFEHDVNGIMDDSETMGEFIKFFEEDVVDTLDDIIDKKLKDNDVFESIIKTLAKHALAKVNWKEIAAEYWEK